MPFECQQITLKIKIKKTMIFVMSGVPGAFALLYLEKHDANMFQNEHVKQQQELHLTT